MVPVTEGTVVAPATEGAVVAPLTKGAVVAPVTEGATQQTLWHEAKAMLPTPGSSFPMASCSPFSIWIRWRFDASMFGEKKRYKPLPACFAVLSARSAIFTRVVGSFESGVPAPSW